MSDKSILILISIISINGIWYANVCEARYLPTRSQEDRLSKLAELLQDILKTDDRNGLQRQNHLDSSNNEYFLLDDSPPNDGYPTLYERGDESRVSRRFLRPQSVAKSST